MNKTSIYFPIIFILFGFLSFSQTTENLEGANETKSEFEVLVNYLQENGNFINSEMAPALISPDDLRKNSKNEKYLTLDIRSEGWFEYGHIKNAVNINGPDLLNYFLNEITPEDYEKISIVCYSGQSASYYASLLRLAGYDNVFSLEYGMSSWREDFAEKSWLKNIKNDFGDKLETVVNTKSTYEQFPVLNTGKTTGKEILMQRLEELFAIPYKESIIKPIEVFEPTEDYYVMHYWDEEIYAKGHIPGAVLYKPNYALDLNSDLNTLPIDKKIAVYDANGLGAAYTVAYLNLLGYDVGNVAYGANGFMNNALNKNKWNAFTKKDINMFPVIE